MKFQALTHLSILAMALLCASRGQAISRIGGGVASSPSHFTAQVPPQFSEEKLFSSNGAETSRLIFRGSIPVGPNINASTIVMTEFSAAFQQWLTRDPNDFSNNMKALGFSEMPVTNVSCAQGWYKSVGPSAHDDGSNQMIIRFGSDQGVSISGSRTNDVLIALKMIQDTIQLTSGTCTWK